ncbi:hypothetical protein ACQEVC_42500 [Plantactinospora sp. CA-294935]|uniref:hypothetical protein n=1 Tax=Plantactinospora sp. CA-294935 TaxID=3240012 RepID=UPI003D9468F5
MVARIGTETPGKSGRIRRWLLGSLVAVAGVVLALVGTVSPAGAGQAPDRREAGFCVQQVDGATNCYADRAAAIEAQGVGDRQAQAVSPMSLSDCLNGRFCFWAAEDYNSNYPWHWRIGSGTLNLAASFPDVNNSITSVANRRDGNVWLIDSSCSGYVFNVPPGVGVPNLSQWDFPCGGTWNNKVDVIELF